MTLPTGSLPLVGRPEQVVALERAVARTVAGAGGALLLVGEAGVGKSRLAEEARRLAQARGLRVFTGRAVEGAGPYRPLAQALLRAGAGDLAPGAEPGLAAYRPALARLLPGWAVPPAPPADPTVDLVLVLGEGVLRLLQRLFAADLDGVAPDPPFALHAVTEPGADGVFVASGRHRWAYGWTVPPDTAAAPRAACVVDRIRAAAGLPGLDLELLGTFVWRFEAEVATRFRVGPVFLVGDAATRTSPRRATGMNTGMAAAHNLAWKLAWVVKGWADPALLDTYEEERLPVGRANALRSLIPATEEGVERLAPDFGFTYRSAAVQAAVQTVARLADPGVAGPHPGDRAPHAWTGSGEGRRSMLDLFDGRLTLLVGRGGSPWCAAADRLATPGSAPMAAVRLGADLADPGGVVAERYGLRDDGAVLVRPDGHLAWRSDLEDLGGRDVTAVLHAARGLALGAAEAVARRSSDGVGAIA